MLMLAQSAAHAQVFVLLRLSACPNLHRTYKQKKRFPEGSLFLFVYSSESFLYIPMQDVAPRAVRMADATEAMICTTHFSVSFFVIRFKDFNG